VKELREELAALSASLRAHLAEDARRGTTRIPFTPPASPASPRGAAPAAAPGSSPSPAPAAPPRRAASPLPRRSAAPAAAGAGRGKKLPAIPPEPPAPDYETRMAELAALGKTAAACTRCGLAETRTQVVFARGRARNRVMFIGEAPGADEDAQGLPFVGRAGKLLDQIIDAVGFARDEIYVANILKCRPPQNRDPRPEEAAACTPYLEAQIELVNPKIICALGRHAAQFLTGKPGAPMGQLRGRIHYYRDRIPVLPTYHPAALLRNPGWKRTVWEDVQLLRREYLAS
jgi:uracil-DNA glycosylase